MKNFFVDGKKMRMAEADFRRYLRAEYPHEYNARYGAYSSTSLFSVKGMR